MTSTELELGFVLLFVAGDEFREKTVRDIHPGTLKRLADEFWDFRDKVCNYLISIGNSDESPEDLYRLYSGQDKALIQDYVLTRCGTGSGFSDESRWFGSATLYRLALEGVGYLEPLIEDTDGKLRIYGWGFY